MFIFRFFFVVRPYLKLSGEKSSAERNAWGSAVYSFYTSGFLILSSSPTHMTSGMSYLWFTVEEVLNPGRREDNLQFEFKLLPYF